MDASSQFNFVNIKFSLHHWLVSSSGITSCITFGHSVSGKPEINRIDEIRCIKWCADNESRFHLPTCCATFWVKSNSFATDKLGAGLPGLLFAFCAIDCAEAALIFKLLFAFAILTGL